MRLDHDEIHTGIVQDQPLANLRSSGIERHVGAAGLQNPQHAHQHGRRTLHAETDRQRTSLRRFEDSRSQCGSPRLKLSIRELVFRADRGNSVGIGSHRRLEGAKERTRKRGRRVGGIAFKQQLVAFAI